MTLGDQKELTRELRRLSPNVRSTKYRRMVGEALRADRSERQSWVRYIRQYLEEYGRSGLGGLDPEAVPGWNALLASEPVAAISWEAYFDVLSAYASIEPVAAVERVAANWDELADDPSAMCAALIVFAHAAGSALPPVQRMVEAGLRHADERVRAAAALAARQYAQLGADFVPRLVELAIEDPSGKVTRAAAEALVAITPDGRLIDIDDDPSRHALVANLEYAANSAALKEKLIRRWNLYDSAAQQRERWIAIRKRRPRLPDHLLWLKQFDEISDRHRTDAAAYRQVMYQHNRAHPQRQVDEYSTIRKGIDAAKQFLESEQVTLDAAIAALQKCE